MVLTNISKISDASVYVGQISASEVYTHIYWHWTYPLGSYNNTTFDRPISDTYGAQVKYGKTTLFYAFESNENYPQPNGNWYKAQISGYAASSFWWYKFDVYSQECTECERVGQYRRVSQQESNSEVAETGGISDVKHYVKFRKK